jgi:hypothetical protein
MNRWTFLTTLAGGAIALPCLARDESADEKIVYDLLDAAIDAQFSYDFPRLVALLHPDSTKLFRNVVSARFDRLMKAYSVEAVRSATGLDAHPKDLQLSDSEFFVTACEKLREIDPDFIGSPKYLPLTVHGCVFDANSKAFVVYSFAGRDVTTRTDYLFNQPGTLTFLKEQGTWQILSAFLSREVAEHWLLQLSKPRGVDEKAK